MNFILNVLLLLKHLHPLYISSLAASGAQLVYMYWVVFLYQTMCPLINTVSIGMCYTGKSHNIGYCICVSITLLSVDAHTCVSSYKTSGLHGLLDPIYLKP